MSKHSFRVRRSPIQKRYVKGGQFLSFVEMLEVRQLLTGTWTALTNSAPGPVGTMLLLPNGSVMTTTDGDGAGSDWAILTPSSTGSYVNGTWTKIANANDTRLFDSSDVLQDGSVFVAGGEYGSGASTGEVYNPLTNTWTRAPAQSYGAFIDSWSSLIPDGNVLITPVAPNPSGYTTIYDPTTNSWSQGPKLVTGGSADEQSWVKLADGSILTVQNATSERYIPSENKFVADANLPASLSDSLGEYGPAFLLPNGDAFFIGSDGLSAIYTPSGSTSPGSWVAGPSIPGGLGEDDASGAALRDGTIMITAGPIDSYNGPTSLFIYNPTTNSFSSVSGPNTYGGAPFLTRMLELPNGDILYTENGGTLYQYDPGTTALSEAVPTITSVTPNSNGSLTLTGTNLNGIDTGAAYGDDAQMDSNYPVIRLTSGINVYYARSYNWTNTGVQLGSTSESVNFTLPLGIPAGTYSLAVTANGVPSAATSLTISTNSNNTPPTVVSGPSATPTTVTGTTTALSVLGADNGGESSLTYTWTNTSAPAGASTASFSINGTNAAQNTTVTFHQAGTYTFDVTITDAGGLSVTTGSISVLVNQTLTSVSMAQNPINLTAGQSQQLDATGYDQFGNPMVNQPVFTWALTSGGGTVNSAGTYFAPATGTEAIVTATTGSLRATTTIGVVNIPWTASDIGNLGTPGIAYDTTSTTLSEASDDIWGTSDDFLFDYQELSSTNITMTAELDSQTSASTYIKAGLMIRNTLNSEDEMAMVCDPAPGPLFEWRTASDTNAAQDATSAPNNAPYWLQLVRNGSTFTAYSSPNDSTWTEIGSQTISMNTTVYVGLALCSHNASDLATAVFSNVTISSGQTLTSVAVQDAPVNLTTGQSQQLIAEGFDQNGFPMSSQPAFIWALNSGGGSITSTGVYTAPATGSLATVTATAASLSATATVGVVNSPWAALDIGSVAIPGVAYNSGATTTLTEGSDDIWNQADDFLFDYQPLTGNGSITAELVSQSSASSYIKAGLMIRNTLASNSAMAMVCDPAPGPLFEWRTTAGATAAQDATGNANTPPYWLRLIRNGSTITGYSSSNGTNWVEIGAQTIPMSSTVYIGLALCSHNPADSATAAFSNITVNQPTVATAASASPSPATGTTASLSVLGANPTNPSGEATLTYTWAATTIPTGATAPTFSANGTNAAKNITVTFHKVGSYTFTVTIADSVGDSITSSVTVTVNQTLSSIQVSPSSVNLNENATQTFIASGYDQFGAVLTTQPTFTWAVNTGIGSINSSGVYTSPASAGSATITATSGSVVGIATVTVTDANPTVTTPAAASPSPVTGTTTVLSVSATDDGGTSNLTYTWAATTVPVGAASPTFSPNGVNAANVSTATFSSAGAYAFTVTISDGQGGIATSSVNVTVDQTLSAINLSAATVAAGQTTQATAVDQFGDALATQPSWSATGGSINTAGLYTAGSAGGTYTITATVGATSVQTNVGIVPTAYSGTTGADTYAIRISPSNSSLEQIFVDTPETGSPTYTIAINQLSSLTFTTASDGSVTVDFTNGNPLPADGISYTGGNALVIDGSPSGGMGFTINATQVIDTAAASSPISYSSVQSVAFDLSGGNNSLTQLAQPGASVTYNAGAGANTLNVSGGTFTFTSNPQLGSGDLTVNDNSAATFSAGTPGSGINTLQLAALNLGPSATATLQTPASESDRSLLIAGSLSVSANARLDLGGNDMDVIGGNLATLTSLVAQGYDGGLWQGDGITSSAAAADPTHLTALGILLNNDGTGNPLYGSGTALGLFDGFNPAVNDVLVKYTYYGDANLDGKVDASGYSRIDNGYLSQLTGWSNGDFNYDGVVDGSDYTLIDNAFNMQAGPLSQLAASSEEAIAGSRPVADSPAPVVVLGRRSPAKSVLASNPTIPTVFSSAAPITPVGFSDWTDSLLQEQGKHKVGILFADDDSRLLKN